MTKKLYAPNAWIFPLLCWLLTFISALARLPLGAFGNLALGLGQLALLIAAMYTGIVVLLNRKGDQTSRDKTHAIAGLVFVGLTFLIIVIAISLS